MHAISCKKKKKESRFSLAFRSIKLCYCAIDFNEPNQQLDMYFKQFKNIMQYIHGEFWTTLLH